MRLLSRNLSVEPNLLDRRDTMNTERQSRNPRSAVVSAEDQPQQPGNGMAARGNQTLPVGPTCCGWCSAHTAALREKSSGRASILPGCSTEKTKNSQGARRSRIGDFSARSPFFVFSLCSSCLCGFLSRFQLNSNGLDTI